MLNSINDNIKDLLANKNLQI